MPRHLCALMVLLFTSVLWAEPFDMIQSGKPVAKVYVNTTAALGNNAAILTDAGAMLVQAMRRGSGAQLVLTDTLTDEPTVIIARADQYPAIADKVKLNTDHLDAYCIVSSAKRLYLLGTTEVAACHAVAGLLYDLGFRYYNPSPKWWIAPSLGNVRIDANRADEPKLLGRNIWYAYGVRLDHLRDGYDRWRAANMLFQAAPFSTGHSYGNIVGRNAQAFAEHPEFYAMNEDGQRPVTAAASTKFCFSNPDLIKLVVADRIALLKEQQQANPYAFMVSVDPSDGQGTCHCKDCEALGTETDRVIYLANAVAREIRKVDPRAWVGLYGYSTHRLPPTIDVEPNVYVQVAMGFNRTQYSLDELVSKWAEKVSAIGLREYYGVEAWDWGLPGRMRGSNPDYHARWIPFYAQRNVNAINAEANANWGGQTLGFYLASRMMWDPDADAGAIQSEFFRLCYGKAAEPMRRLQSRFDQAPKLSAFNLSPMFEDLAEAYKLDTTPRVRQRLIDMMAYLNYVAEFARFETASAVDPDHGDTYYNALKILMRYAWQTRERGMIHSYALARRLCNGLPLEDGRFDFWIFLDENHPPPQQFLDQHNVKAESLPRQAVWIDENQLDDPQIVATFMGNLNQLKSDSQALRRFSDQLVPVTITGDQTGHAGVFLQDTPGQMRVRNGMSARLLIRKPGQMTFTLAADSRSCEMSLNDADGAMIFNRGVTQLAGPQTFEVTFKKPGMYRVNLTGSFTLTVPTDAAMAIEASPARTFHAEYSGGNFFYVPRGTKKLLLDVSGRLSLMIPGQGRLDVSDADRDPQLGYVVLDVPEQAAGEVWETFHQTRGTFYLINVPPWLMVNRGQMLLPRDLVQKDQR